MMLAFLATAYRIWEVPFSMEPPSIFFTTKTVSRIPTMGKMLLIKLNLRMPFTEVAMEKTLCANDFKMITANAAEIPTKTLERKINCLLVSLVCDQAMMLSIL
jgi:hypothetical protein